jgi:hypothetical protein
MKMIQIILTIFIPLNLIAQDAIAVYDKCKESIVSIEATDKYNLFMSQGSGVVISDGSLVVTNFHIYEGYKSLKVITENKVIADITIVGIDIFNDLLIIKLNSDLLKPISMRNEIPLIGEQIITIGNPNGYTKTISNGIVSGLRYDFKSWNLDNINLGDTLIQFTAPITNGSSGGALLDRNGNLIGITTISINSGKGNLFFAVSIKTVNKIQLCEIIDCQNEIQDLKKSFSLYKYGLNNKAYSLLSNTNEYNMYGKDFWEWSLRLMILYEKKDIEELNKLITEFPKEKSILNFIIGLIYIDFDKPNEAIQALQLAIFTNYSNSSYYYYYAKAFELRADSETALHYYLVAARNGNTQAMNWIIKNNYLNLL